MADIMLGAKLWKSRRVLLSGHTGFKGAWMVLMLKRLGAEVYGVALAPDSSPNLSEILGHKDNKRFTICDMRDKEALEKIIQIVQPEIVIHMAAQALVKESYIDPVGTIASNIMGTVHLLECLRSVKELLSVLVITSDKVYENRETGFDFAESAALGGHDPYSASKAAVEILTSAYRRSFFNEKNIPVITARAGNVIGGGDWAKNRLLPDLWRANETNEPVFLRNPKSVRPWQHVLDPLYGYFLYIQHSITTKNKMPTSLNFGPPREPICTVQQVAKTFSACLSEHQLWTKASTTDSQHESQFLSIDSTLSFKTLGWQTALSIDDAIRWTVEWYKAFHNGEDMVAFTEKQIDTYADRHCKYKSF